MKSKILLGMIVCLCLIQLAYAQVEIIKNYPKEITAGSELSVEIILKNAENFTKKLIVIERIDQNAVPVEPGTVETVYLGFGDTKEQRYSWDIMLAPLEEKRIVYRIKVNKVGAYNLYQTKAMTITQTYLSNADIVDVKCVPNNSCEQDENNYYCPQDCQESDIQCYTDNDCGQLKFCDNGSTYRDIRCLNNKCVKQTAEFCKTTAETKMQQKYNPLLIFLSITLLALVISLSIFHHYHSNKGTRNQLRNYIRTNLKKGYSKQQVKAALVKSGYSNKEIEEEFRRIR